MSVAENYKQKNPYFRNTFSSMFFLSHGPKTQLPRSVNRTYHCIIVCAYQMPGDSRTCTRAVRRVVILTSDAAKPLTGVG